MRVRQATRLTLTLLVAAGMGVCGSTAAGQATQSSKPNSAKHRSRNGHTRPVRRTSRRDRGQKTPAPERISEIQSALAKDSSFGGTPNGKWDDNTVAAVKKFQGSHGLNPTGKLDAKTLQKLGLGSQTAGLAPPTPPVSSSSLSASPAASVPRLQD